MRWRGESGVDKVDGTYRGLVVSVLEVESVFPYIDTDEGNEGS